MFTPYERRQLRQIEQWFEEDDPQLAKTLRSGPVRKPSMAPQIVAIVVACALAALGIITSTFVLLFGAAIAGVTAAGLASNRRNKHR
jgi:ribulose kinase